MQHDSANTQQSHKEVHNKIPPGFTLRHSLIGHSADINDIAWSPDGAVLAIVRRLRHETERSPKPPPHTGADVAPVPAARSDEAPAVEP